jgi:uncharacterized protein YjbI with pentapeptide repeats
VDLLTPGADLDGLTLTGDALDGQDGESARILECSLDGCSLDGVRLDHARVLDTTLTGCRAGELSAPSSTWQDGTWTDLRIGALVAYGSSWDRVRVTGGKLDFVNLRDARLTDVTFEGVTIDELDLARVTARRVRFDECRVRRLDVTGAALTDVDLRGLTGLTRIDGVTALRGATISGEQLVELAPALAEAAGITVTG